MKNRQSVANLLSSNTTFGHNFPSIKKIMVYMNKIKPKKKFQQHLVGGATEN